MIIDEMMNSNIPITYKKQPTVAIIGCGPSGMLFINTVNRLKKLYTEHNDTENLLKLPIVTCFEKASSPGGVWRSLSKEMKSNNPIDRLNLTNLDHNLSDSDITSNSSSNNSDSSITSSNISSTFQEDTIVTNVIRPTNMYESLWMNAPKELIEFFDYTYEEHFQCPLPAFLCRQQVLEYIIGRVTHQNPYFFDNVQFNSSVEYVTYNDSKSQFEITIQDNQEGTQSIQYFDKCIWAAGNNGIQKFPKSIHNMLTDEGYKGKIIHSADIGSFFSEIEDKRLLLIGDSYSGEDVALKAVKLGAKSIIIYSRSGNGVCCETGSWPMNKIRVEQDYMPYKVVNNGHGIQWIETNMNMKTLKKQPIIGGKTYATEHLDFIIYCTGYTENVSMLDDDLKVPDEARSPDYNYVSKDFIMSDNIFTKDLGTVIPYKKLDLEVIDVFPDFYRGALISNPNMMYICEGSLIGVPLFEIDVYAHELLYLITGKLKWPDNEETIREEQKKLVLSAMEVPELRRYLDVNYDIQHRIVYKDKKHWSYNRIDERMISEEKKFIVWSMKYFAQLIKELDYPVDLGDFNKLNETGNRYVKMMLSDSLNRYELNRKSKDSHWKTFRDLDDTSTCVSIHSGAVAIPFDRPWLEIKD